MPESPISTFPAEGEQGGGLPSGCGSHAAHRLHTAAVRAAPWFSHERTCSLLFKMTPKCGAEVV